MKKLFGVFLIVFILCFTFCYADSSLVYRPSAFLTSVASSNGDNFDLTQAYLTAYDYFALSPYFNQQNYVYILPSEATRSTSSAPYTITFYYIGSPYQLCLDSRFNTDTNNSNLLRQNYQYTFFKPVDSNFNQIASGFDFGTSMYIGRCDITLPNSIVTASSYAINNSTYTTMSSFFGGIYNKMYFSRYSSTISNYIYYGSTDTTDSFYDLLYSKNGVIYEWSDSAGNTTVFTGSANSDTTVYSDSYYNVTISRDDISMVSDGTSNFYRYTNIDFGFSNYFAQNVSPNATLYYTIIIDNLEFGYVPITEATNGYTNNRVTLDLGTNQNFLGDIYYGLTLVLWYKDGTDVKQGETSYKFYVNAYSPSTGTSSSGSDNNVDVTGVNGSLPTGIDNTITYNENLDNAGLTDNSTSGISNADMTSRFKSMFSFFSTAFSWLPREIIVMVEARFCYCSNFSNI